MLVKENAKKKTTKKKKQKKTIGQMFCAECPLVKKTLLEWFNRKFKSQNFQINPFAKIKYERSSPIDWRNDKCVIRKSPLKVGPTNYETSGDKMTFGDFRIRYEHEFLRNIYTKKKLIILYVLKICKVIIKLFKNIFTSQSA